MPRSRVIRIRLFLDRRLADWGLLAFLLFAGAGELASESLVLSTFYPAPLGVYKQVITTGSGPPAAGTNTLLARDAGVVGIRTGLTALNPKVSLTVQGIGSGGTAASIIAGDAASDGLDVYNAKITTWNNIPSSDGNNYFAAPTQYFQNASATYATLKNTLADFNGDVHAANDVRADNDVWAMGTIASGNTGPTFFGTRGSIVSGGNFYVTQMGSAGKGYIHLGANACGTTVTAPLNKTTSGVSPEDPVCGGNKYATYAPGIWAEGNWYAPMTVSPGDDSCIDTNGMGDANSSTNHSSTGGNSDCVPMSSLLSFASGEFYCCPE